MSTKSVVVGIVMGLSVGVAGGFVGMNHINDKKETHQEELQAMTDGDWDKDKATASKNQVAENKSRHIRNLGGWVDIMEDMPPTEARTNMANSVIKAAEDNIITESEYESLSTQFNQFREFNVNERTKNNATKIRDGEAITDERSESELLYEILSSRY